MAFINFQPKDYFNTKLYTGNGSNSHAITGVGFEPSFVWIKDRTNSYDHCAFDQPRGVSQRIYPNNAQVQSTDNDNLVSFDSDGFTVDDNGITNHNGYNFVSWNWKANGAGSSNTDGSITSTVSASTTSGFSIVTWTGNSGSIGHGLGKKPAMLITKSLGATGGWYVTHKSLSAEMQDNYMFLNDTSANSTNNDIWGGEPTTSTFSVGSGLIGNTTHVAYCFAPIKGFSAMGSYTGNGNADGVFLYTGFKPAWFLWKPYNATDSWNLVDSKRDGYNPDNNRLFPNASSAEDTQDRVDLVSNGIKIRTSDGGTNSSSRSYIYMAFAEAPLVGSNNVPATAR